VIKFQLIFWWKHFIVVFLLARNYLVFKNFSVKNSHKYEPNWFDLTEIQIFVVYLLPILATHCNANVTCIGLRLDKSFFIAWITNFIKSLWALIITDINKYPWNKQQIFVFLSDQISLVHICVSFSSIRVC
jgi:hypothetical protein